MPVQTQMQVRRGTASSWTSTNPTLAAGELGFETDTGKFKIGTGSSTWTALPYAGGGQNTLTTYQYTATAGQTTFSGADINSNTLSYTAGAVQVYLNGALLQNTVDYAASTGTSVVLTAGAGLGDSLTILSLGSFTVSTDIPKSTLTAKGSIIAASGAATPANLSVGANDTVLTADSSTATGLKWAPGGSAAPTFRGTFSSSTTISVGTAKTVYVMAVGGGGGGQSGTCNSYGAIRQGFPGGVGGCSGMTTFTSFLASGTLTITIGAGGTGGAAPTVAQSRFNGSAGGNTIVTNTDSVTNGIGGAIAFGGGGGRDGGGGGDHLGSSGAGGGGGSGYIGINGRGGVGGAGGTNGATGSNGAAGTGWDNYEAGGAGMAGIFSLKAPESFYASGGGGGGGGGSVGTGASAGGAGGATGTYGLVGATGGTGGAGAYAPTGQANGSAGTNGALGGGGGGGGGVAGQSTITTATAGAGGNGGSGYAIIWF